MNKGVIFDLDGIVVDTVPIHFKAWKKMFEEYGAVFTFDDYKAKVDGIPRINGTRAILTDFSDDEIDKAANTKQKYFREFLDSEDIPVYKSTIDLICFLKENNIPRVVISSSKNCIYILKKIGIFDKLNDIIDGTKINKGKPDPEIFLLASGSISTKPVNCIVFEDAVLGVEAAKNAGMYCIGVDRYNDPERLSKADRVIHDISEITHRELLEIV